MPGCSVKTVDCDACDRVTLLPCAICSHPATLPTQVLTLAVLPDLNVVVGASYLPVPSFSDPLGPALHVQPVLHRQLHQLLLDGRMDHAVALVRGATFRRRYCLEVCFWGWGRERSGQRRGCLC